MPDKLKKLVRARMAKTNESYQTALRHVRAQAPTVTTTGEAIMYVKEANIIVDALEARVPSVTEKGSTKMEKIATTTSAPPCIFCSTPVAKALNTNSKEHIAPQWLQEVLAVRKRQASPVTSGWGSERVHPMAANLGPNRIRRREGPKTFQKHEFEQVCRRCNNEWMSRLETAALAVLLPLIEGTKTLASLSEDERAVLARWCLKTAYVSNRYAVAHGGRHFIPEEHGHSVMDGNELPPGFCLVGAQFDRPKNLYTKTGRDWPVHNAPPGTERDCNVLLGRSYKALFDLGPVVLMLVYWPPFPPWRLALCEEVHEVVWQRGCEFTKAPWDDELKRAVVKGGLLYLWIGTVIDQTFGISYREWVSAPVQAERLPGMGVVETTQHEAEAWRVIHSILMGEQPAPVGPITPAHAAAR